MKNHTLSYFLFKYLILTCINILCYYILDFIGYNIIEDMWYIIAIATIVLYEIIEYIIYKPKNTLANKISKCELRKLHGSSYCADCKLGYTCANIK
jgi:membrane protein CcdC involved in cytochrome C biogenesis